MLNAATDNDVRDEGRFRLAMASSGIGMAIVDLEGRWVEVNPAIERMFGYTAAELQGRSVLEISHPDDVEDSKRHIARLGRADVEVLDAQKRYLHREGNIIWVHLNVAIMRGADGEPCYFISQLRDVTAEHEAREALTELNATLEQRVAERTAELEALARQQELFAYGISHDLRAPLRAIDSFSALLASSLGEDRLDDASRDYLARIRAAAGRMGKLIDALLELSRATRAELHMAPVDLSLLAEWAAAELADAEPERGADIQVQPGLRALGDERQLKLLLDQLLGNAWKFSRDRERVEIRVEGAHQGDRVLLSVRDHGVGFDMSYAAKLFEPFQRLHGPEQAGGNGIGLAIAKRIVERHRGRIWADSEPGTGSAFHVELPAVGHLQDNEHT